MIPALIIPASFFGFFAALVRLFAFDSSFGQAALTYLAVTAAVGVLAIWMVKTAQMRGKPAPHYAIPAE